MTDFDVCIGTGDFPTGAYVTDEPVAVPYDPEPPGEGFIMDSTGKWIDPTDYIDTYYADW